MKYNTINEVCPKNKCSGCSSCYNSCKQGAILMTEDSCGYIYPEIYKDKCIGCGACQKSCPVNTKPALRYPLACFAASLPSEDDLRKSASGGAATILMRKVIQEGGIVYGCSGEDVFHVCHLRIESLNDIDHLRGSKYVQSNIGGIYKEVKKDLQNPERQVLFTGTPCQVAGLRSYLRKDYNNLITIDLVCHGVPSQKMLTDNIRLYTNETDGHKIKVAFRRKVFPAKNETKFNSARIEFGWFLRNQPYSNVSLKFYKDPYMFGFLSCLTFRESCYTCRYATSARVGDITVSDFWGLADDVPFEKGKGVSSILLNTEKGAHFFETVKDEMTCVQRDPVEAIVGNGQLQMPSKKNHSHYMFRQLYPQIGFESAVRKSLRKEIFEILILNPFLDNTKKIIKLLIGRK